MSRGMIALAATLLATAVLAAGSPSEPACPSPAGRDDGRGTTIPDEEAVTAARRNDQMITAEISVGTDGKIVARYKADSENERCPPSSKDR